jgi:hypothetical protein
MAAHIADYEAATTRFTSESNRLSAKLAEIRPAALMALNQWYITPGMADAIIWLADKVIELGTALWHKLVELARGIAAPYFMFQHAYEWMEIKGHATGIATNLRPEFLAVDRHWQGRAADAYVRVIQPQVNAAARIGTMADKTAISLSICGAAATAFYLALGIIVLKFFVAITAAIAAFWTAVLSWAGAAIIVEEAAVNTAAITAAVGALLGLLATQATTLVAMHGEAVDRTAFPDGHWPNPAAAEFSDGTVRDRDADWSIQR